MFAKRVSLNQNRCCSFGKKFETEFESKYILDQIYKFFGIQKLNSTKNGLKKSKIELRAVGKRSFHE